MQTVTEALDDLRRPPVRKRGMDDLFRSYPGATALYHLYDAGQELLYIGIAVDPRRRFKQHKAYTGWWPEVRYCEFQWWPTRDDALEAELAAIREARPTCNRRGVPAW